MTVLDEDHRFDIEHTAQDGDRCRESSALVQVLQRIHAADDHQPFPDLFQIVSDFIHCTAFVPHAAGDPYHHGKGGGSQ